MMKKLLVLSLVLVMASLASAAFQLVGPTEARPSDLITVDFVGDAGARGLYYVIVVEGDPGVLSDARLGLAGTTPTAGNLAAILPYVEVGFTQSGWELTVADSVSDNNILGGTWASLTFHCEGPGDATINVYRDPDYENAVASLLIHQVPEPMTLALLGLGALALRKRK